MEDVNPTLSMGRLEAEVRWLRQANQAGGDEAAGRQHAPNAPNDGPQLATESMNRGLRGQLRLPSETLPDATIERTHRVQERQPPLDLVLSLASLFFRHIHPWLPYLDAQRVLADIAAVNDPPLLYYALFGVSLPFSYDSRLDQEYSDSVWKYTKRRIFLEVLEEPSYAALEALTVLVLDLSGMTNGPQVWGALAVAIKLAVQLNTAGDRILRSSTAGPADESLSIADQVFRSRVFWAIYTIDSYVSITTAHRSQLTEHDVRPFLLTRTSAWEDAPSAVLSGCGIRPSWQSGTASPMLVFTYQLELLDISRRLHAVFIEYTALFPEQRSTAAETEAGAGVGAGAAARAWMDNFVAGSTALGDWGRNIPPWLRMNGARHWHPMVDRVLAPVAMLHAYYHALTIYLHGLVAYAGHHPLGPRVDDTLRAKSWDSCATSVACLINLAGELTDRISDRVGWPFAWSMWTAARYLLALDFHYDATPTSRSQFRVLLATLRKLGCYWQISSKYWRLLTTSATELSDSRASPTDNSNNDDENNDHNDNNNNGNNNRSSSARKASRILRAVVDMRVSTSDLEDQFRTDPVLHNDGLSQTAMGAPSSYDMDDGSFLGNAADNCFSIADYMSDSWFSAPLLPSSAFQLYTPTTTFDSSANTGGT
ncbi:hypothetical protein Sste5346_004594 [Sporothrix stenoceras]|uniref:Xylanolytic transcriptional activator regulatory domain-containing protein n=1 Tax=Sporothrix stenoceras TaxID=5173 RepID=A0ABR3Z7C8_9PEZI